MNPRNQFRRPVRACGGRRIAHPARRICLSVAALGLLAPTTCVAQIAGADDKAETVFAQATPAELGLQMPEGETPQPGDGRRVLVPGLDEKPVAGEVYLEYRDHLIVLLPNGWLISVPALQATATDRPFVPATQDEIVAELTAQRFKGFKVRKTRRHVFLYNCSEPFCVGTSTILNTMYGKLLQYCQGINKEAQDPRFPLVVILFRTAEEFQKYRPMPPGVVAYYNGVSNHVLIYEQSGLSDVAPELALKQAISTIAHEGVHQVLHNVGVQQRLSRWPMWVSEGLPEYFAPTQVGRRARWKGIGQSNDLRMHTLIEYLKEQRGATIGLQKAVETKQLDALGYARSWALVHYLAKKDSRRFFAFLGELNESALPGHEPEEPGTYFEKHFGADFEGLEKKVFAHLRKQPYTDPIANQTHYVGIAEAGVYIHAVAAFSLSSIQKWHSDVTKRYPPGSVKFRVQAFPNRAAAQEYVRRNFR